ncbi:hypothetical protein NUW58_g157 [Xylaria curta]|uniref:Uncharacterized protein n=1 Tax=Xylaria curta TaxID=42375 RepID=A0ACC1PQ85_9PEZI|nr:hypothetical protein NUW58_g157 [Xylaria curta]
MANEATAPYPKGSAEYTATYLTTRSLGCSHLAKYRPDDIQGLSKYPRRLGFFHITAKEPKISLLDTTKLCNECLDNVVPDGFCYWSTYSIVKGTGATDSQAPQLRWLNMAPSSDSYPPLTLAGTEGFPHVSLRPEVILPNLITPTVVLSIPKIPGAKEAWEWLQAEEKPFYIDQLHLVKGWSSLAERLAKNDSTIAERIGIAYHTKAQPEAQAPKRTSLGNKATLLEEEAGDSTAASPKTRERTKVTKSRKSVPSTTTESTGSMAEPSVKASDEVNDTSLNLIARTTQTKLSGQAVKNTLIEKTAQFIFTKNWSHHDPIPFGSPIALLELSDYKQAKCHCQAPVNPPRTPGMAAFLRPAELGKSETPANAPGFMEKLIREAPPERSSITKTKQIKSDEKTDSKDKPSEKAPTTDERYQRSTHSLGENYVGDVPHERKPTKPSEIRCPAPELAIINPAMNKPLADTVGPTIFEYRGDKGGHSKLRSAVENVKFGVGFSKFSTKAPNDKTHMAHKPHKPTSPDDTPAGNTPLGNTSPGKMPLENTYAEAGRESGSDENDGSDQESQYGGSGRESTYSGGNLSESHSEHELSEHSDDESEDGLEDNSGNDSGDESNEDGADPQADDYDVPDDSNEGSSDSEGDDNNHSVDNDNGHSDEGKSDQNDKDGSSDDDDNWYNQDGRYWQRTM